MIIQNIVINILFVFRYGITNEMKKSLVPLTKCDKQFGENCFVAFECGTEATQFVQALHSHVIYSKLYYFI